MCLEGAAAAAAAAPCLGRYGNIRLLCIETSTHRFSMQYDKAMRVLQTVNAAKPLADTVSSSSGEEESSEEEEEEEQVRHYTTSLV